MDKMNFAKNMEILNAYYVNFKLDLSNKMVQTIWYKSLEHLSNEMFDALTSDYCMKNEFAPQSPTHLLNHLKSAYRSKQMSADAAWQLFLEMREDEKFKGYSPIHGGYVKLGKLIDSLDDKPQMKEALSMIKDELDTMKLDNRQWVKKHFVEIYDQVITQTLNQKYLSNPLPTLLQKGGDD